MLWCSTCNREYDDNNQVCPECGGPLETVEKPGWGFHSKGDDLVWPVTDSGEVAKPVFLTKVTGSQLDFEMTISQLRAFGIPTQRKYPQHGEFVKMIFGITGGGMDIYVPEEMLDMAKDVLKPIE